MFLIFILSSIEINLYSYKDTYLLGEDIWIWWEIVNMGESLSFYQKSGVFSKLFNDAKIWDVNGREIPGYIISGTSAERKRGKGKFPMLEIKPGDTIRFREVNLIGISGTLRFSKKGIANLYIKPGEYFFTLFYWTRENGFYHKVWADTISFYIVEPSGPEKPAWNLYKTYKQLSILGNEIEKQVDLGLNIMQNYPESNYIGSLLKDLAMSFGILRREEFKNDVKKIESTTRQFLVYLKENIYKLSDKRIKNTLWCIIQGELMLGSSKDEIKNLIIQMNIPVDNEIKVFLKINN
jgi:hypothetical protein